MTSIRKPWGISKSIHSDPYIEVVRIEVAPGGYCSRHLHQAKSNAFQVIEGILFLTVEPNDGQIIRMTQKPSSAIYVIPPQVTHRFEAPVFTVAYEIYFASPGHFVDANDIVRYDCGGLRTELQSAQEYGVEVAGAE